MNILFFNRKGGSQKTSSSTEVASSLALKGKKVLLMDFDSQGNVAQTFGVNPFDKIGRDTYTITLSYLKDKKEAIELYKDMMLKEKKFHSNLDIIYGTVDLSSMEIDFFTQMQEIGPKKVFGMITEMFAELKKVGGYDYIIIDTSPTMSIFQAAIMNSADKIFVPSVMEKFSQLGIIGIIDSMKKMAAMLNIEKSALINKIEIIIPTKIENVKDHKAVHKELFETLPKFSSIKVLPWEEGIPKATEFSRTVREKETTPMLIGSKNKATLAYDKLVDKYILKNK